MHFDYKGFHIDCRARHDDDGHYVAQAKLTRAATSNTPAEVHQSGDIDSFVDESDAMTCARDEPVSLGPSPKDMPTLVAMKI